MTLSVRPPTCSVHLDLRGRADPQQDVLEFELVETRQLASGRYGPGTREGTENVPSLPLIVSRATPLSRWVHDDGRPGQHAVLLVE